MTLIFEHKKQTFPATSPAATVLADIYSYQYSHELNVGDKETVSRLLQILSMPTQEAIKEFALGAYTASSRAYRIELAKMPLVLT